MRTPWTLWLSCLGLTLAVADAYAGGGLSVPAFDARGEPPRAEPIKTFARGPDPTPGVLVSAEPRGERVELDVKLRLRFDRDVERGSVEQAFYVRPPASGRFNWFNDRSLEFVPDRLRPGRVYEVGVGGLTRSGAPIIGDNFRFRTRVPEPKQIVPGQGSNLVLSFDDGTPSRRQAKALLDLLKERDVRALFFPTGKWARKHDKFVERARAEGHLVCNHTLTHTNLSQPNLSDQAIRDEIAGGAGAGSCPLFRPPMMAVDERVQRIAHELGYSLYLWDIDTRDWEDAPAEDIQNLVLGRARPDSVVLFHLHGKHTLEALSPIIDRLREAGYVLSHDPNDALPPGRDRNDRRTRHGVVFPDARSLPGLEDELSGFSAEPPP